MMALNLVYYGNETLKNTAEEILNIDQEVVDLVDGMFNVMYRARGIGLAAPQVDIGKRIIVVDIEEYGAESIALVNPVIKEKSDQTEPYEEGCLSLPGISEDVIRPSEILVHGVTLDGAEVEIEADSLFARVLQHEIDHLNGVVFTDHLEDWRRQELRSQFKKIKKMNR